MANAGVFETGYEQGVQRRSEPRLRQQALKDQETELKIKDVQSNIGNLQTKIADLKPGSPEYADASKALTDLIQTRNDLFHPVKNPGVLQKFGHLLKIGPKPVHETVTTPPKDLAVPAGTTGPVKLAPTEPYAATPQTMPSQATPVAKTDASQTMAVQNPQGLIQAGNITIWDRPTIQNDDGSHSSELSVSFADDNGHEILVPTIVNGKFLTPDGKMPPGPIPTDHESASPEWKALWDNAWKHYESSGQHLGIFDSAANADAYAGALHSRKAGSNQPGTAGATLPGLPTEPQTIAFPGSKPAVVKGPDMTPTQLKEKAENMRKSQAEAKQIIAAAPMSQENMQLLLSGAQDAARLNSIKNTLAAIPGLLGPDAKPEDIERAKSEYMEKELGLLQKENYEAMTGTVDGQPVTYQRDKSSGRVIDMAGQPVPADKLAKFAVAPKNAPKPGTSAFAVNLDSYAKSHGFKDFASIPDEQKEKVVDFVQRKIAFDRAMPSSTTTTSLKQDIQGNYVPVTETNYRTPGANIKLADPLPMSQQSQPGGPDLGIAQHGTPVQPGKSATPPANAAPKPGASQTPSGTHALLQEAKTKQPGSAVKPPGGGNTKVGAPLFKGRTPSADKAKTALDAASTSYQDVLKASADPTPVGDQGVVLAWLRGRVNRVTATEIAAVSNLGGAQLKLEGQIVKILSGKMTDEQRSWFLKSAKDNYDIAKQNYDNYVAPIGTTPVSPGGSSNGAPEPGANPDIDAIIDAINGTSSTPK